MPYTFLCHHHGLNENHPPLTAERRCTSPAQQPRSPPRSKATPPHPSILPSVYAIARLTHNHPIHSMQHSTPFHSILLHSLHPFTHPTQGRSTSPHLTHSLTHFLTHSHPRFKKRKMPVYITNSTQNRVCYAVLHYTTTIPHLPYRPHHFAVQ
jgi:hypothetical protein